MITVTLTEAEIRRCTYLAVERWLQKMDSEDKESYAIGRKNKYLEHDLVNSVRANISEWAVARHYALSWNGGFTYPNSEHGRRRYLPDVGVNLEVRTRRTGGEFAFWEYEVNKEGYAVFTEVVDDENFKEVRIVGWLPIEDCGKPEYFDKGNKRFYVPTEALNDPESLFAANLV